MREWELIDAPHVSVFNEFLRRLDLGVEIEFKSFPQYAELLMKCCELVRERRAENTKPQMEFHDTANDWCGEVGETVMLLRTAFRYTENENITEAQREELDNLITVTYEKLSALEKAMIAKINELVAIL